MTDTTTTSDPAPHADPDDPVIETGKEGIREPTPYEKRLRTENARYRTEAKTERELRASEVAAAKAEAENQTKTIKSQADERVKRAELKALAAKEGMVDIDGLKLADLSKVTINDAGEVEGASELFADLKKAKPYLFGAVQGTSSTQTAPNPTTPEAFNARTAKPEDVARRQAELTKNSR